MSRGFGKMQDAILGLLNDRRAEMTVETMRWELFDASNPGAPAQDLPDSWNSSFSRAAKKLEEQEVIHLAPRRLGSFEECIRYYPDKTLLGRMRAHRLRLLPQLCGFVDGRNGIGSRYDVADNEKFHLKGLPRVAVDELGRRWFRLEESLRPVYGQATESPDDLLGLINRGRYLFRRRDYEYGVSLKQAIEEASRKKLLPKVLSEELRAFYNDFMPEDFAGPLQLKNFVHSVADVPSQRQCSLKPKTMEFLLRSDEAYVTSMPGFKEPPTSPDAENYEDWMCREGPVFSPELIALFNQSVFQKFGFVSLNGPDQ